MIKSLHSFILASFLLITNVVSSQSSAVNHLHSSESNVILAEHSESHIDEISHIHVEKVFSYNHIALDNHSDHDHSNELSFMDILSSDEGSDFNCSGGFCMIESHFHKKGLTIKRQLFVYFMSISC